MHDWTLTEIVEQLESCYYVCAAGRLENNTAFMALKELAANGGEMYRQAIKNYEMVFRPGDGDDYVLAEQPSEIEALVRQVERLQDEVAAMRAQVAEMREQLARCEADS